MRSSHVEAIKAVNTLGLNHPLEKVATQDDEETRRRMRLYGIQSRLAGRVNFRAASRVENSGLLTCTGCARIIDIAEEEDAKASEVFDSPDGPAGRCPRCVALWREEGLAVGYRTLQAAAQGRAQVLETKRRDPDRLVAALDTHIRALSGMPLEDLRAHALEVGIQPGPRASQTWLLLHIRGQMEKELGFGDGRLHKEYQPGYRHTWRKKKEEPTDGPDDTED